MTEDEQLKEDLAVEFRMLSEMADTVDEVRAACKRKDAEHVQRMLQELGCDTSFLIVTFDEPRSDSLRAKITTFNRGKEIGKKQERNEIIRIVSEEKERLYAAASVQSLAWAEIELVLRNRAEREL